MEPHDIHIFFTVSNHSQTYQDYQQSPQRFQNKIDKIKTGEQFLLI